MIDTVSLKFQHELEAKQLSNWIEKTTRKPDGLTWKQYRYNLLCDFDKTISTFYYPPNPGYKNSLLKIEFSIPGILFGNNVMMVEKIDEIESAIHQAEKIISRCQWIPPVNLMDGVIARIDLCYNYQVGERVREYIRALSNLEYPHRRTRPYLNQGVQFLSNVVCTKFYDKFVECGLVSSYGILRHETTLHKTYYIEKKLRIERPTLQDINFSWVKEMLQVDLKRLKIIDCSICNRDVVLETLMEKYGWLIGTRLFGFWNARQVMDKDRMILYGANKQKIQRCEKKIFNSGLGLSTTKSTIPLPPIFIKK